MVGFCYLKALLRGSATAGGTRADRGGALGGDRKRKESDREFPPETQQEFPSSLWLCNPEKIC